MLTLTENASTIVKDIAAQQGGSESTGLRISSEDPAAGSDGDRGPAAAPRRPDRRGRTAPWSTSTRRPPSSSTTRSSTPRSTRRAGCSSPSRPRPDPARRTTTPGAVGARGRPVRRASGSAEPDQLAGPVDQVVAQRRPDQHAAPTRPSTVTTVVCTGFSLALSHAAAPCFFSGPEPVPRELELQRPQPHPEQDRRDRQRPGQHDQHQPERISSRPATKTTDAPQGPGHG